MKCEQAQKLISDRLDGKLGWWGEKGWTGTLLPSEVCRDYLLSQEIIQREALKIGEGIDYPPEWWRQFEQALKEKIIQSTPAEEVIGVPRVRVEINKTTDKKRRSWAFKPYALRAVSLLVAGGVLFLIIYIGRSKNEELPLPLVLSYEDSYFNLSQILAEDEEAASNLARSLEEAILQETIFSGSEGEFLDIDYYYETDNRPIRPEDLQIEKHKF